MWLTTIAIPMHASTHPAPLVDRFSVSLSLLFHAGTVVLLMLALGPHSVMLGPTLPALMLYAPDHRPDAPRERQVGAAMALGSADDLTGSGSRSLRLAPTEGAEPRPQRAGVPTLDRITPTVVGNATFDSVFSVLAVDSQVVRVPGTVAPRYPAAQLAAGIEGAVDVEFVVDTTGRVDVATLEILQSSDSAFSAAVATALAEMQFRPAWRAFRHVRQRVTQRFSFKLTKMLPPQQPD